MSLLELLDTIPHTCHNRIKRVRMTLREWHEQIGLSTRRLHFKGAFVLWERAAALIFSCELL